MLPPNTAKPGRSVWDRVGRETFERHTDALHRTKFVPDSQVLLEKDWPKQRNQDGLPFAVEKQLTDDFAFIAAYRYGARYVTAAAVEPGSINELLSILQRCARKELSREQCAADAFDTIVKLNSNRILGRLASSHFHRPSYMHGTPQDPLTLAFHASFLQLEDATADEIVSATKSVVKEAFGLTVDGFSLPARLKAMGFAASRIDTREIHEVNKLANYWRVCLSLAHLSRSYRGLFTRLRLETLEPYEPSSTTAVERFVHAEIQLVAFYETSLAPQSLPRAIGASKEACFLCDSFIKAHGHFFLSKAHRQIYPHWTVPDREDYSTATLKRFRSVLMTVDRDVPEELEKARCKRHSFQKLPLQSSVNLHKLTLPTPSVTTDSSSSKTTPVAKLREDDNVLTLDGVKPKENSNRPLHLTALASSHGIAEDVVTEAEALELTPSTSRAMITFTSAAHMTLDWLSLHIHLEDTPPYGNGAPVSGTAPAFSKASVYLKSVQSCDAINSKHKGEYFSVGDLAPGEEKVIARPECNEDVGNGCCKEIELTLTNGARKPVRVRCRWYRAEYGVRV
ncbi:hypothetical protein VTN77DRAFT_3427 [Rasamsonia byssochlamydoides]|uniref:uncharacterized protein n=1 Tax=Rasamsonia byssochlamydoides TaxID=89139 RepID=UPI0037437D5B